MKTISRLLSGFALAMVCGTTLGISASNSEIPAYLYPPTNTLGSKAHAAAMATAASSSASVASTFGSSLEAVPDVILPPPTTNYVFPAIGTLQKVTDYAAQNVTVATIFAWAFETNGQEVGYGTTVWYKGTSVVTNKSQLDQQYIVPGLSNIVLYNFCTNANPMYDKSKGMVIYVGCDILTPSGYQSQDLLYYGNSKIQLIKNADGSWSVPNLSAFSTIVNDPMPFYFANVKWVRTEVGNNGNSTPFAVYDNRYTPGSSPLNPDGFVYLPSGDITNSASTGGKYWIKTEMFGSTSLLPLQIFDGNGNSVAQTPAVLNVSTSGYTVSIETLSKKTGKLVPTTFSQATNLIIAVNNKDSGTAFYLQSSTNLADTNSWVNCTPVSYASATNGVPNLFSIPTSNKYAFFRTARTNTPPQ